jgi:hypothetical protein
MGIVGQRPTARLGKIFDQKQLDPHGAGEEIEEDAVSEMPPGVSKG